MSVRSQTGSDTTERTEPSPVAGASSEASCEFITVLRMGRADCTQQKATLCSFLPHPCSTGRTTLRCSIFISILHVEIVSLTCNFHVNNTAWMHVLNPKTNSQQPQAIPWLTAPGWGGLRACTALQDTQQRWPPVTRKPSTVCGVWVRPRLTARVTHGSWPIISRAVFKGTMDAASRNLRGRNTINYHLKILSYDQCLPVSVLFHPKKNKDTASCLSSFNYALTIHTWQCHLGVTRGKYRPWKDNSIWLNMWRQNNWFIQKAIILTMRFKACRARAPKTEHINHRLELKRQR